MAPESFTYIDTGFVTQTTVVPVSGLVSCSSNYTLPASQYSVQVTAACQEVGFYPTSPGYQIGNLLQVQILDGAAGANYYFPLLAATNVGTFETIPLGNQGTLTVSQYTAVTPEPSSIALLGTGMLGVAGVVRRRFV